MKIHYDQQVDALYIRLDDSDIIESEEVKEGIILDYNKQDQVVGIEILKISKRIPLPELKKIQFELA
ncbi:hypothetical protein BMS3Abin03_00196 [bacterium BMS3Abin03]|nr:hypothetical protein BMS3Abin03_00196 [bacterium BMS3Abin03]